MTVTRHKTILEIGVDDREVQGLSQTMERAFDPAMVEGFTRSIERLERTLEKLTKSVDKLAKSQEDDDRRGGGGFLSAIFGGGRGGGGRRGKKDEGSRFWQTAGGSFVGTAAANYMGRMGGQMAQGGGFVGSMAAGIPIVGPAFAGALSGIQNFHQQYIGQQQAVLGAYGRTGIGNQGLGGLYGAGARLGLGPGAIPGLLQGYSQQTGLSGAGLAGVAPQLMAAQQMRGFGSLGSILGGAGAAGGKLQDPGQLMEDAIASGFQIGIRESRMDQYLAQLGGWTESVRNQGINLSMESAAALTATMGNLGLKGQAGLRAAQSFQQAMGRVGKGGGFGQVLALRAAGLGSGATFMQARAFAEGNPEIMMQRIAKNLAAQGFDREGIALQLETVMDSLGVNLGGPQAYLDAADNVIGGKPLTDVREGAEASEAQRRRRAKGIAGAGAGALAAEAGLQRAAQNVGAGVAQDAIAVRKLEMRLAANVLPKFAKAVGGATDIMDQLVTAFSEGGLGGLTKAVGEMTVSAQTVIVESIGESFEQTDLGRSLAKGRQARADKKWGAAPTLEGEEGRKITGYTMGMRDGKSVEVPMYADEGGGSPLDRAAYHGKKQTEALEEAAQQQRPGDRDLQNTAN